MFEEIPRHVQQCFILSEDRRFWQHRGVDLIALARAIKVNTSRRKIVQGGSTITQQLIKNLLLRGWPGWKRKVPEAVFSALLEMRAAKSVILTAYLNTVYFGGRLYGISEASEAYFKKPAASLTVPEAAALAALIRAPNFYLSPSGSHHLRRRIQSLLSRIAKMTGKPSSHQVVMPRLSAKSRTARRRRSLERSSLLAETRAELEVGALGSAREFSVIRISSRLSLQHRLQSALSGLGATSGSAVVALHIESRQLLASATVPYGRSFACQGRIQPGSTLKPFILVAALEMGYSLGDRFRSEETELLFEDGTRWHIRNHDAIYHGQIDLSEALALSDNTVFAQLSQLISMRHIGDVLNRFGITHAAPTPAVVLGAIRGGVAPLNLLNAYATLAAEGCHRRVRQIVGGVSRLGDQASVAVEDVSRAATPTICRDLAGALRRAARYGPSCLALEKVAAKTGTGERDQLVCAFRDDIAALVWIGRAHGLHEIDKGLAPTRILSRLASILFPGDAE